MDKELREILKEFYKHATGIEDFGCKECERYYSAILKLFKQEMLRLIGEDEDKYLDTIYSELARVERGRNQLRAELRKKVGEI
jgi:hypothetical protein